MGSGSSSSRNAVDVSLLIMRIIVGVIFAAHGSQKCSASSAVTGCPKPSKRWG